MQKYSKEEIKEINNIPGIYIIRNKINGKCYIGQSIYLKKRLYKHITLSDSKYYDSPLYRALKKYGIGNFEFDILETLDTSNFQEAKKQLDIWEKEYIKKYNSYAPNGYNQTLGGDAGVIGYKFTEEQKKHQSDVRLKAEQEKQNLLFIYIINSPIPECHYITVGNPKNLNTILNYYNFPAIEPRLIRFAKRHYAYKKLYIIASSKEELDNKIAYYRTNLKSKYGN